MARSTYLERFFAAASGGLPDCLRCRQATAYTQDLRMAFQPIVDVSQREIFAYEALVRGPEGEPAGAVLGWDLLAKPVVNPSGCKTRWRIQHHAVSPGHPRGSRSSALARARRSCHGGHRWACCSWSHTLWAFSPAPLAMMLGIQTSGASAVSGTDSAVGRAQ